MTKRNRNKEYVLDEETNEVFHINFCELNIDKNWVTPNKNIGRYISEEEVDKYWVKREAHRTWDNIKDDVINKMPKNYDSSNQKHRDLFTQEAFKKAFTFLNPGNNAPMEEVINELLIEYFDWDKSKHLV